MAILDNDIQNRESMPEQQSADQTPGTSTDEEQSEVSSSDLDDYECMLACFNELHEKYSCFKKKHALVKEKLDEIEKENLTLKDLCKQKDLELENLKKALELEKDKSSSVI